MTCIVACCAGLQFYVALKVIWGPVERLVEKVIETLTIEVSISLRQTIQVANFLTAVLQAQTKIYYHIR